MFRLLPLFSALVLLTTAALRAAEPQTLPLWPDRPPGEAADLGEEIDQTKESDGTIAGRPLIRLGNVSKPTITVYPAPADKNTGAAVLVCPGGGYGILALDLEGTEVCEWLNSIGITGILLKYRVPVRAGRPRHEPPLQDAQRALSIVRSRAADWQIDPQRIGILGFSAGGHLAAVTSSSFKERSYPAIDTADEQSTRPDFTLLIYPAFLTTKEKPHELAPEVSVTKETPPAFVLMTQDDSVRVENALTYSLALKNAGVPCELHVYATGGHGYGLRPTEQTVTTWPKRAEEWLRASGFLNARR
jgi:acetyl esterase/lipase